jgi:hypothetical protein
MFKAALLDALPLAALLVLVCGGLATLVRVCGAGVSPVAAGMAGQTPAPRTRRPILNLHSDEQGSVQSLSFVLTVPLFIMLMLLAVQITQLMIGEIIVHYAAFAAVRSAAVWIPARLEPLDMAGPNRIGVRTEYSRHDNGTEYVIRPGLPKYEKIRQAAALACVPIAPSRDLGLAASDATSMALQSAFATFAPQEVATNARLPQRLANKWGYASRATSIVIHTFHRDDEPLLVQYGPFATSTFTPYEIGWRDEITVTVTHNFALLPGPGRLLARRANESQHVDSVSRSILQSAGVYYLPLSATATLVPEGEKSVAPYVHQEL